MIGSLLRRVGRWLQPLLNPDAEWQRAQLKTIRDEQRRRLDELDKRAGHYEKQIERLAGGVARLREHDLGKLRGRVVGLDARIRRGLQFNNRVLRRITNRQQEWHAERALKRLARLAASGQPILAGPWTGEVGFELLYWIPFIRWFAAAYEVDPNRLIVLSRGGTEAWYSPLGDRYLDAFDLGTLEEFRHHVAAGNKQLTVRTFDRLLLRRAKQQLRVPVGLLYPALMYHLLMPFLQGQMGSVWAARFGRYVRYDPPPLDDLAQKLPDRYVAVRFYHSACFPDTARTRAFVRRTLEALTASEEVVLIAPGTLVDDHRDALVDGLPQVHVVSDLAVARNLAIQTAIISRARRFVGTYGGFSYLAPLCGVPAVAFYAIRNFRHHHLLMASEITERIGGATLTVIDVADVDRLREVLPMIEPTGPPSANR